MLTSRYMTSVKNLPAIMKKVVDGTAPDKFTMAHLKGIGFKSSNDQGVIPLLKDLGFLTGDGTPTARYHEYRDPSKSRAVMADALHEAYEEIFHINELPSEGDRPAIEGKFKSVHNGTERIAKEQTKTFFALLELADLNKINKRRSQKPEDSKSKDEPVEEKKSNGQAVQNLSSFAGLRYNIEIHLPPTKDVEVYNAIFKSLKEHLIDD